MANDETIMVVEDDDATREFLADNLRADSYGVVTASSGRQAFNLLEVKRCDLLLLDVMLPDASGYELCRRLRSADGLAQRIDPNLPVIMLTGRSSEADRVRGFTRGADDYVVKPFHYPELVGRIGAVLRRSSGRREQGILHVGELRIDPVAREVTLDGRKVELSAKEFALLRTLAAEPARVFTKEELLRDVWGYKLMGISRHIGYSYRCTMKAPKRLDGLIRVSQIAGREGESFRSPAQQREACERWAEANGAEIVAWQQAVGRSGKTMDRADVDAALERIRGGQTDGVIVAWLDRFSRAPVAEALGVYNDISNAGGQVVAVDMAGLNPNDATGEMALTVMLSVNRMQWRKVAERYDQTRREAIADGKAIGGAPFGYRFKDPTSNGRHGIRDSRLVVHPGEAKIVRELFERKVGGATWLELARWLDTVAPKSNGGHWARNTARSMIMCKTYLGQVQHGPHVKIGAHEPIVSTALWRRAQNKPGRRTPRGTYLLSGLVRCAGCARRMRGTTLGRGAGHVYACADPECKARSTITVGKLDAEVTDQFFRHLDAFHVQTVDHGELDAARVEVERRTEQLEALAAVIPSHPTAVAAHQTALHAAERQLIEAEDHLQQIAALLTAEGPDVRELHDDWPSLNLAEKREILRAGIDAVLVRRAPSPTAKPPAAERILVLFRGTAPVGLADNGRSGPVTTWTWNDDPSSLTAAS